MYFLTHSDLDDFDFSNSEYVKLDESRLNRKQIQNIVRALNKLRKREIEIYSKPSYQITYEVNGSIYYISIFEKEKFVFNGYYLDAWTERMEGNKSTGYKLDKALIDLINELKSETEPRPVADRGQSGPSNKGRRSARDMV